MICNVLEECLAVTAFEVPKDGAHSFLIDVHDITSRFPEG
jgi:hypothetical protein